MSKPYIVFFTGLEHGRNTFIPVYEIFKKDMNIDTTLIWWNKERKGLFGEDFELGCIKVSRKPDVVVSFSGWWDKEVVVGKAAAKQGIPVVMIDHGATFVFSSRHKYKKSIYPASVNCLWGQHDLNVWRRWNKKDKLIVTGNPLHDQVIDYTPPEIDLPDEFALLLPPSTEMQRRFLNPSAEKLNKIIPVVAKTHPIDKNKDYYKQRYLTYDEHWMLLPLLYRAKLIIANVSSSWMPAMLWQKPIFIHSFDESGFCFNEFKDQYPHIFNYKQDDVWNSGVIDRAIKSNKEHFKIFGHIPDGKNSIRVAEVIKSHVE